MSSWQSIQNCRSNGTDQHSWTASDGTRYENCYNFRKSDGSEGSGNTVPRNPDGSCNYSTGTTKLFCKPSANSILDQISQAFQPQAKLASVLAGNRTYCIQDNTACPGDEKACKVNIPGSKYNGMCYYTDTPYNTNFHKFDDYTDEQKKIWTCKAGQNAKWSHVAPNKPSGNTWWVNGKCTNDVVEILTKGKCDNWHDEIDVITNKNAYFCRNRDHKKGGAPLGKYTNYHLEPGSADYHGAQVLNNLGFVTERCHQDKDRHDWRAKLMTDGRAGFVGVDLKMQCYYPPQGDGANVSYCDKPITKGTMHGNLSERRTWKSKEWYNLDADINLSNDWVKSTIEKRQKDNSYGPGFGWVKGPKKCRAYRIGGPLGYATCENCSIECDKENTLVTYGGVTVAFPDRNRNNVPDSCRLKTEKDPGDETKKAIEDNVFKVEAVAGKCENNCSLDSKWLGNHQK